MSMATSAMSGCAGPTLAMPGCAGYQLLRDAPRRVSGACADTVNGAGPAPACVLAWQCHRLPTLLITTLKTVNHRAGTRLDCWAPEQRQHRRPPPPAAA